MPKVARNKTNIFYLKIGTFKKISAKSDLEQNILL